MSLYYRELETFWTKLKAELDKNEKQSSVLTTSFVPTTEMKLITFPVVHGLTGGTHPSVKYFPRRWNGYSFWMAYTPYPGIANENPVIVASNDGYNWITPSGLSNPISPTPNTGYNSDTELVYAPGDKLYCYWRWYTDTGNQNILYRMESTNGKDWTNKISCILPGGVDPLSPCILVDAFGNYKMWIGASRSRKMRYLTSSDGITWIDLQDCNTDIDDFGFHWHPMVWREAKYYYCLSAVGAKGEHRPAELMTDLYFGRSSDGLNWDFDSSPLVSRGQQGLKNFRVYRSSAVRVGDRFYIYVSGNGNESEQIHIMEAILAKQ